MPAAAINIPMAPCQRFSPVLAEWSLIQSMNTSERLIGMTIIQPTARFDQPEASFNTVGIQYPNPQNPVIHRKYVPQSLRTSFSRNACQTV